MPGRLEPIVTNEIYHIFNRGIASQPTFFSKRDYVRALESFFYYQNANSPIKYSRFLTLPKKERFEILQNLFQKRNYLAEVISYCLMPNHFHFLLKQTQDEGIAKLIGNFTNSYTRYINTKQERTGPLFGGKFKSVRIETQEQLLHVSRYIHLNPYTSFLVKATNDLREYRYSSFPEFIGKTDSQLCMKEDVLASFKSVKQYEKFVFDQADYQRTLGQIKHTLLD